MKEKSHKLPLLLALILMSAATPRLFSAGFDSGSDGSYGILNVPAQKTLTLNVPPDGVFRCTTITVGCNSTLNFIPNNLNTPVHLLATGDVTISGYIVVNGTQGSSTLGGAGGPGGFAGGMGGIAGGHNLGGDGTGPGGGKSLANAFGGVYGAVAAANTNVYGNALLYPLIGGSGGAGASGTGGGYAGGGGGGAILIASNTQILFQFCNYSGVGIYSDGGNGANNGAGGGSGGAIRLVAPLVTGPGNLEALGGTRNYGGGVAGSPGRIRVDCTDDYAYRTIAYSGSFSRGSQMFVFKPNSPQLDITSAAGQPIPVGTANAVTVSLPLGAPTNQVVTLSAQNFTNDVAVRIAVTPDTGPSANFDGVIKNTGNLSTGSFNVVIPAGTISRIFAWTR